MVTCPLNIDAICLVIVAKKDGWVWWISNVRELNKFIKQKVCNLPKMLDILLRRARYTFLTKLDISMQYYTFGLDKSSKEVCPICTPFGNCRYNWLPIGICQSPDIAQETMEDLLWQFEEANVYINHIGVFSNTWSDHLSSLSKILTLLEHNNFTINPLKCEWGVKETDWLSYWLTPTGLKRWKHKIQAILVLERPKMVEQLRSFIGAVTFYRDMFPKRSHILAPLTALVGGKGPLKWTAEFQQVFVQMKAVMAQDAFLRYPNQNKPFPHILWH
jgi:Reverse transcriptase (RNA-dependent DNA polymerase)